MAKKIRIGNIPANNAVDDVDPKDVGNLVKTVVKIIKDLMK